jgi:hypothetical protein
MKLLGRDFDADQLLRDIQTRLEQRGLSLSSAATPSLEPERTVDPLSFNLQQLEQNADSTRPLPLSSHRGGLGRAVLLAKWAFRKSCQVFINETLARQRLFNENTRQAYAELSAEMLQLKTMVATLTPHFLKTPAEPHLKKGGGEASKDK